MKNMALPAYTLLVTGWMVCLLLGGLFAGSDLPAGDTAGYKSIKWMTNSSSKAFTGYRVPGNTIFICSSRSYINQAGVMLTARQ